MNATQVASLIIILLTTCLPIICLYKINRNKRFVKKAVVTDAAISYVEKRAGFKGSVHYFIKLTYKTVNAGQVFNAQTVSVKKRKVGDVIPVMYLKDKPEIFKTDFGKWLHWWLAFSFVFLFAVCWLCYWLVNEGYKTL